jgi:hypothetical protein
MCIWRYLLLTSKQNAKKPDSERPFCPIQHKHASKQTKHTLTPSTYIQMQNTLQK